MLRSQHGGTVKFRSVLTAVLLSLITAGALPCTVIGQDADALADNSADLVQDTGADSPADASVEERKSAVPNSPQEIVKAVGWPFTIVFGFASIVALWCGIERLVLLRRRRVIPRAFVDRFLQHLRSGRMDKPNAIAVCQQDGSPTADVFLHGVRKWGKPSVEIEQAVIDGGERQISQLKKRLRVLNGVATLSPLIGLLGTVIGMIQAFNDIAESNAMGQAEELARGIAMALLTTAIGLFIAIPALTAYMYLAGRIDALVMEMDRLGQELVHLISAEALRERGDVRPLSPEDLQAINKATKEKKS
ncbi:MAG: MotA/TolQ/ExbB proton channel family protein [Fuerstiella sp.]